MKVDIKETIRQVLIKIVLPLRRKKEILLGKFRFSIAFRISLHYLKILLLNGILFIGVFSMVFMWVEWRESSEKINLITSMLSSTKENVEEQNINPYLVDGISLSITDLVTGKLIYSDLQRDLLEDTLILNHILIDEDKDDNNIIIYTNKREITINSSDYIVTYQLSLSQSYKKLQELVILVSILYILLVYLIIRQGKKSDQKLLQPIYEMSATANRLTVNNLHSKRLNVDGTKNELKDLANVINNMLDRIEISYESQKQFVSDASHELRTPIAVIQGYANLLNRWGTKNEEVMLESIDAINNEAKSMQELVEKLLFLSRHDKKTLKLEKHKFNMCEVVEEMVKETKLVTSNRNIECVSLCDVEVYGDKQALKQAIRVFIDNAVKYTKDGDKISISCENHEGDCVITVSDTGIGMTRKDLDNIFERFYRSEQVRNEKIYGHGLGLSIAKLIILGHTGRIKIRSQLTKGTTFIITLPKRF